MEELVKYIYGVLVVLWNHVDQRGSYISNFN